MRIQSAARGNEWTFAADDSRRPGNEWTPRGNEWTLRGNEWTLRGNEWT